MKTYSGYISKWYFPESLRNRKEPTEVHLTFKVKANSRLQAAHKAWEELADICLPWFEPHVKRVCLHVNDPKLGKATGAAFRLEPIKVWEKLEQK